MTLVSAPWCCAGGLEAGGGKGQVTAGAQEALLLEITDVLLCVLLFKMSPFNTGHICTCNRNSANWL